MANANAMCVRYIFFTTLACCVLQSPVNGSTENGSIYIRFIYVYIVCIYTRVVGSEVRQLVSLVRASCFEDIDERNAGIAELRNLSRGTCERGAE